MVTVAALPRSLRVRDWLVPAFGYFACASAAIAFTRFDGGVSFLWLANAFLLAWLSMTPTRAWGPVSIACIVANCVATTLFGLGPVAALPLAIVNIGESVLTATWLRRRLGHASYFDSVKALTTFVVIAGVVLPMASGVPGAAIAALLSPTDFGANWARWVAGHALGTITFTPFFLLIFSGEVRRWIRGATPALRIEAAGLMALMVLATSLVFGQNQYPMLFFPLLPMMMAAVRLGRFGAAGTIAILTVTAGLMTIRGYGPINLIDSPTGERAQFLQFYAATAALVVLPVAALLKQYKSLMNRLSQSEARHRMLEDHMAHAVLNVAVDGTILYASQAVRDLGGFDPAALIGRNARDLVVEDDLEAVVDAHRRALMEPGSSRTVEYRGLTEDGRLPWFETTTRAVIDDEGVPIGAVSVISDVTARKARDLDLSQAANTDPLTGLFNRRAFMALLESRAERVRAGEGHCSVALFDLDHFKQVNDTYGHAAGDAVLQSFADTMRGLLRDNDVVGRIGGEEFGVILWNADPANAAIVVERLNAAIAAARVAIGNERFVHVTASAGITPLTADRNAAETLKAADEALYAAKAAGRNCVRWAA